MISRRSFLQHSACLGTAAGFSVSPVSQAVAAAAADMETVTWSACSINCGSRCILRCVSKKGRVIRIETDNTGDPNAGVTGKDFPQVRACHRGRSIRQRLYAPERLKYPMKRAGKRGENKWTRISWDEALDIVARANSKRSPGIRLSTKSRPA